MIAFKLAKLLKVSLIIALSLLCALLAWALVLFVLGLNIQWWAKAMVLTCLAATAITIILLRKMWRKRREMKFVDGIIGSDMPGNISAIDDASRELRRRFKEAVSTLKKSHLKGRGNPLYVLPWYLIIGKSGSGKSTAIKSARLPSPFGDINRISGIEGTRNCDWWFFDDSVVIDIAGRYSVHSNGELDRSEWLAFLKHLARYRKREPINGIIVTVEADSLLEGDLGKIDEEGRTLRQRVDEAIQGMGAKVPIYLLITKCDLIFGMDRFVRLLPQAALDQAMGMMNHDSETDIAVIVNRTVDNIVNKLKDFRLILANRDNVRDRHFVEPEVLLFPDELSRIRKGLMVFCKGAFKDNPFQELPPVRGIYFCSAQQSGRPVVSRMSAICPLGGQELPGTGHGFFLHDFFARIMPADRFLYAPTRSAKEWSRITGNLWLTAYVTLVLICCIFLTHSWNENKSAINAVSPQYKKAILFKNEPVNDIAIMAEFGDQIKKIEKINATWKTPRLGLKASIRLEKDLKQRYCKRFNEHFDADINNRIEAHIANGGFSKDSFEPAIRYIPFITRRINMLKARFDGAGRRQLAELPDPDYALMSIGDDRVPSADVILSRYKNAYVDYLVWQKDIEPINKSLAGMQRLLSNHFEENQGDMRWLVAWANRHLRGKAISMNTFWRSEASDVKLATINPAFTHQGQKLIGHFVTDELEKAVGQSLFIAQPKAQFVAWYQDAYYGAWMKFCADFDKGLDLFEADGAWEKALELLTGEATPYLRLFDTMECEFFPVLDPVQWPSMKPTVDNEEKYGAWLSQVHNFGIIRQVLAGEAPTENSVAKSIADKLSGNAAIAADLPLEAMGAGRLAKAKEAYRQYQNAIAGFAGITKDKKYAYGIVRSGFEDSPAEAKSHLFAAGKAMANLKMALVSDDKPVNGGKEVFWPLFGESLDLLWQFSVKQAGEHLQDLWDQEVIVAIQGVRDPRQMSSMLFDDQGLAQNYIRTYAKPFIQQSSARGLYATKRQGAHIPFHNGFFDYIKRGEHWWAVSGGKIEQSYTVKVVAYPTDVNVEARLRPYMTRLVLEGEEGATILENKQYPVEKNFIWRPAYDGNVVLQIVFENITLVIRYSGHCAFGQFLNDFSGGYNIFKAEQFPDQLNDLERIGVKQIEVAYQLQKSQIQPIVKLMSDTPGRPPGTIIAAAKRER